MKALRKLLEYPATRIGFKRQGDHNILYVEHFATNGEVYAGAVYMDEEEQLLGIEEFCLEALKAISHLERRVELERQIDEDGR